MKTKTSKILVLFLTILFSLAVPNAAESGDDKADPKTIKAPPAPVISAEERRRELSSRRKKVAAKMQAGSMLILMSADKRNYSRDVDYSFRQENNLYYLTALGQPGATLVMIKKGAGVSEYVFLPKRDPRFETWNGRMYSTDEAKEISGIAKMVDAGFVKGFLESLKAKKSFNAPDGSFSNNFIPERIYLVKGGAREYRKENALADELSGYKVENAAPVFAGLRLVKSPYEIKLLQHAIDITIEAVMRSMGMVNRAKWEYEVQAEVEYTFRRRNADFWGYPSIVGSGPNATTLHYEEAQGRVRKGDLLLMDVGAEYDHYTADITRTFPVSGKFSKEQADIYNIVYEAQEAAALKVRPGIQVREAGREAARVIEQGLAKLGLITAVGATYDVSFNGRLFRRPQYTLWYMHGWGHWIGMNVHDVGRPSVFAKGMVTTNEPGIYIRADALEYLEETPGNGEFKQKIRKAFEKYRNIGVRIEDDMLVTDGAAVWMTRKLPRSIEDVEAFMRSAARENKAYRPD